MAVVTIRSYVVPPDPSPEFRVGRPFDLEVDEGTTLSQLIGCVLSIPRGEVAIAAVDGQLARGEHVLKAQDRVDLFPPIMGG